MRRPLASSVNKRGNVWIFLVCALFICSMYHSSGARDLVFPSVRVGGGWKSNVRIFMPRAQHSLTDMEQQEEEVRRTNYDKIRRLFDRTRLKTYHCSVQ